MKQEENYSLLAHNTFGMDVRAKKFVEYDTVDELREYLTSGDFECFRGKFIHIGAGSNLLFRGDYEGLVLHSALRSLTVVDETDNYLSVRVGAGYVWDDFVDFCVKHNWAGVENLSAIPGEVGASAVQNIGAYGVEVGDVIESVETIDLNGNSCILNKEDCCYGYRDSIFKKELRGRCFVTHVVYRLMKFPKFKLDYGDLRVRVENEGVPTIAAVRRAVIAIRGEKLPDPKVQGNAGSFFTNPVISREQYECLRVEYPDIPFYPVTEGCVKIPAGWLIEHSGWKGRSLGRVAVHDRQALVLVNRGGATGAEVMELAVHICEDVYNKYKIRITPEVNYV